MAADDIWYYTRNGERIGPVTELELSNIVARGDLRPDDLVWKEGMPQWVQLRFAEGLPEAPPPEPAPEQALAIAQMYEAPAQMYEGPAAEPVHVPYATPVHALVTYASFGQRFAAALIDGLILLVVRFGCVLPLGMIGAVLDDAHGPSESRDVTLGFVIIALWPLIGWMYYALLESTRWQATLGKRAMSVKVADLAGARPSFIQTSVRYWMKIVSALMLGIGYLMAAFTERRQALHDMAANTIVLYAPQAITPMHYVPAPVSARL